MQGYRESTNSEITASRLRSKNTYAYLNDEGNFDAITKSSGISLIEQKVQELHKVMWKNRNEIWPNGIPSDPVDLLNPQFALEFLGYSLDMAEYLGEYYSHDSSIEVAGTLDRTNKKIRISNRLHKNSLRFTMAHELGHVLLHNETVMHRDKAVDGSHQNTPREPMEFEADKFSALYLMPKKLVKQRFKQTFGVEKFILNEETAFALDPKNSNKLIKKNNNSYDLAKTLASADHYNGNQVNSLAAQFRVSVGAMAIRIRELGLI